MTNRFDTSQQQQYVSSYIPLPFEQIGALGSKITKEHASKQEEADALANEINKIKVANEVISEGSGEDLGIKSRSTGYGEFKNQVLNKYSQANKQLADDYQAGKLDTAQFSQKVNQLKNDFSGDYQKLKIAEANSVAIEEADKKYREAKHAGANPHVLNALAEEGARLRANPYSVQYKGAPISELVDTTKKINDYSNNYADQIMKTYQPVKDVNGYITYKDTHGVGRARIMEGASANYDLDNELTSDAREQALRVIRDNGIDLNSEKGKQIYTDLLTEHKTKFITSVVDKAEKSVQNLDRKKDWQAAQDRTWAHDQKVVEDATNVVGNALPGDEEVNIVVQSPEFQSLSAKGLINTKPGGLIEFNFDGKQTGYQAASGKVYSTKNEAIADNTKAGIINPDINFKEIPQGNKALSNTDLQEMNNFVINAAQMIGYSKEHIADMMRGNSVNSKGEKISWKNLMPQIASSYNVLSKSRLGGVELSADVQKVETDKINSSPTSYTVYDPKTHQPTSLVLNKGDVQKAGERVYIKGESFLKATIQRGKLTETVYIKPKSKNVNDYFDRGVGNTQKAIMSLYGAGGDVTNNHGKKYIESFDPKKDLHVSVNLDNDNDPLTPSIPVKVSTFARGQLGGGVNYEFIRDDKNPSRQVYVLHTPGEDPNNPMTFNDYNEFLVWSDAAYYQHGRGKSDLTHLRSKYLHERAAGNLAPVIDESED